MKAIYNNVSEDLLDLIYCSEVANRKIKYVSLTEGEYLELMQEIGELLSFPKYEKDKVLGTLLGVQITGCTYEYKMKKEDLMRVLKI